MVRSLLKAHLNNFKNNNYRKKILLRLINKKIQPDGTTVQLQASQEQHYDVIRVTELMKSQLFWEKILKHVPNAESPHQEVKALTEKGANIIM